MSLSRAGLDVDLSPQFGSMRGLHWIGIAAALVSAGVHLVLGLQFLPHPMGVSFLVATAGFLAGCWLVVADVNRPLVYLLGVGFTLGQIVAWVVLTRPELLEDFDLTVLGTAEIVDKAAQVLLIVVLLVLYTQER